MRPPPPRAPSFVTKKSDESNLFRLAVEASPNCMVMLDSSGRIIMVNTQTERLFGYKRDELLGQMIEMLVPGQFLKTPQARPMGADRDLFGQRKDGSKFPVEITLNPLKTDEGLFIISFIIDISERKRAEDDQRNLLSNSFLAAIVDSSDDAIIGKTLDGIVTSWNHGAERLYGYTAPEIVGKHVSILYPNDRGNELSELTQKTKQHVLTKGYETVHTRKNGSYVEVAVTMSPIKDSAGQLVGLSTIALDITEKKRLEHLKDEFIGTVSHELRTPLTVISMGTENLLDGLVGRLTQEQLEVVNRNYRNVKQLNQLIGNLLDISYLQTGRRVIHWQDTNLVDLIHGTVDGFQAGLHDGLVFEETLPSNLPTLQADPSLMTQVITNLLSNAARYAKRKITITVTLVKDSRGLPQSICTTVANDGPGIPAEKLPELFKKFVQLDRATCTGAYKGTGLGLAICKEIIERHHGKIMAKSPEPQGVQFEFTLPVSGGGGVDGTEEKNLGG